MNERDAFLNALAVNEDDTTVRLVYADWLDEQGEHEEADRQRKWPAAKEWLVRLCRDNNPDYAWQIPYEMLIELGQYTDGFDCGDNMSMCEALRENSREFYRNWSIVTGISLLPFKEENIRFTCRC